MQRGSVDRAGLDAPVTNARHLLDLPAERLAIKISQCNRVLAVNFKMRDCICHVDGSNDDLPTARNLCRRCPSQRAFSDISSASTATDSFVPRPNVEISL